MANVLFTRDTLTNIEDSSIHPVTDGQLLFDTSGSGKMYMDVGTSRLEMGGAMTIDSKLNTTSTNPIQNKAVGGVMLSSLDEIAATTSSGFLTDALATKELNTNLGTLSTTVNNINTKVTSGTVNNSNLWGNHIYDVGTNNTSDTYILVESNSKVQHTLPSTIMNLAYCSYYNGSILTMASDVTMTEFSLVKYGKMCQLFYVGKVNSAATDWSYETKNCGTLAAGYRPARDVRAVAKLQNSIYTYIVNISMNGSITMWNWGSEKGIPSSAVVFCVTYFTA